MIHQVPRRRSLTAGAASTPTQQEADMSETSNATETEDEFPDIETVTDPDLLRLLAGDAQHHLEVASADFKRIVKRLVVLAGSAPNEQQELRSEERRVG